MLRFAKKRTALLLTVPAIFLLNAGVANAIPIGFDFTGKLTTGALVDFSVEFELDQAMKRVDEFTETITYTRSIATFDDRNFESIGGGQIFQRDGTDGEFFPDLWSFRSILTDIGGATITITTQISDSSLSLIRPGLIISNSALFLRPGSNPRFFLEGDSFSVAGIIIAAANRVAVSEPMTLFLFSIGLAGLGFAARRKAS